MRILITALLMLTVASLASADEPRIHLSWGASYGLPGASASLIRTCGDTTRVDTLFLSFDPGRACSTFVGMTATLWFRALDSDTLGPLWEPAEKRSPPDGMTIEFPRETGAGHPFPWKAFGIGHPAYGKSSGNAGRMRIIWAVMPESGAQVEAGKLYTLARLLLRRPAAGAPGCGQPVCVSWTEATMAYRPGDEPAVSTGFRYVGINASGGEFSCAEAPAPKAPAAKSGKAAKKASTGR